MSYQDFLAAKAQKNTGHGFDPETLPGHLFDFQRELTEWAVRQGRAAEALGTLKTALAEHIDPGSDNERLFRIVSELAGTPEKRLQETLQSCQAEFDANKIALIERQRGELESAGIAGTAVLPNPEADPQWKAHKEQIQAACTTRFLAVINS